MDSSDNPYASSSSTLIEANESIFVLASRLNRLMASLIDSVVSLLICIPTLYLFCYFAFGSGFFDEFLAKATSGSSYLYYLTASLLYYLSYFFLNGEFLLLRGQTIGKSLFGIKIETEEGKLPSLKKHLPIRYGIFFFIGAIPVIGGLLSIANILFIFTPDKKCIHDRLAKTRVVVV